VSETNEKQEKLKIMATKTAKETVSTESGANSLAISIPPISLETIKIRLIGDSPLIMHKWSAKSKKMMLDRQMKKASAGKAVKDPEQDVKDCIYYTEDGKDYAFPSVAFKAAVVGAARFTDGAVKMTLLRGAFHIQGELAKLDAADPQPREDMVRVGMGVADLRYRPEFYPWAVELRVTYNTRVISAEQLINLFQLAGFSQGVGEWRPERDGSFGRFHVALEGE
jgi:hypothetical protein